MILRPSPISTRDCVWDGTSNLFVADMSDLGHGFKFERVYDDACDIGLTLISHRTGKEIVFVFTGHIRNNEGELMGWELESLGSTFKMTIFND